MGVPLPRVIVLDGFATGSAELSARQRRVIAQVAALLQKEPLSGPDWVSVIGHTDAQGTDQANDALGRRRAVAVRDELARHVSSLADASVYSMGERLLLHDTKGADPRNRRVEIRIYRIHPSVAPPSSSPPPSGGPTKRQVPTFKVPPPFELPQLIGKIGELRTQLDLPAGKSNDNPVDEFLDDLGGKLAKDQLTRELTKVLVAIGKVFGISRSTVNDWVREGAKAGTKAAAEALIESLLNLLSERVPPPEPDPGNILPDPIPFPSPQITTPEIPFDKPPPPSPLTSPRYHGLRSSYAAGSFLDFEVEVPNEKVQPRLEIVPRGNDRGDGNPKVLPITGRHRVTMAAPAAPGAFDLVYKVGFAVMDRRPLTITAAAP